MALDTSSPQAYVASGGSLTNGQIPTMQAPTGQENQPITLGQLSGTSSLVPPPPTNPTPPNYNGIVSGALAATTPSAATPYTDASTNLLSTIQKELGQDTGKAAYTAEQNKTTGVTDLTDKQSRLTAEISAINDQMAALDNTSANIPNAVAEQYKGKAGMLGQQATTTEQQRAIAIQKAGLASEALALKAEYSMNAGDLANAQAAAKQAVDLKYADLENDIANNTKLLELYKPFMDAEQTKQAEALRVQNDQKAQALADKKSQQKDMIDKAINANDSASASQIMALDPNSPTFSTDLSKIISKQGFGMNPLDVAKTQLDLANARKAAAAADQAQRISDASNLDMETIAGTYKANPNTPSSDLGGLSFNGLQQKAETYLTNGGNIQGLGLSAQGNVGVQRTLIANYGGYLADKMGMTVPQITAAYKANSKAATTIIQRTARIETTSQTLIAQFPRLQQLAQSVGNLGIQESDLTKAKTELVRKFGSNDAASFVDLINTVRQDYSSMQAAVAGSQGAQYFSMSAEQAIPLGLTPDQYAAIGQTIQGSAFLAEQAGGDEANKLIMNSTSPNAGGATGNTVMVNNQAYTVGQVYQDASGAKWTVDSGGNWTKQ